MLKLGATSSAHMLEVIPLRNISYFSSSELTLNKNGKDLFWTFSISKEDQIGVFGESKKSEN